MPANGKADQNTLRFIAHREGCSLGAYPDGEFCSVGFGHNDPSLKPGEMITMKRAFELLKEDVKQREKIVNRYLEHDVTQHVFTALLSMVYQSGNAKFRDVADLVNAGKYYAAADKMLSHSTNKAGKFLPGLQVRRGYEADLLRDGDYGNINDPIMLWRGNAHDPAVQREAYVIQPGDLPEMD